MPQLGARTSDYRTCADVQKAVAVARLWSRWSMPAARPFTCHPFASPFDGPRDPPFGGSHEGRDCTTCMHEKKRPCPARF